MPSLNSPVIYASDSEHVGDFTVLEQKEITETITWPHSVQIGENDICPNIQQKVDMSAFLDSCGRVRPARYPKSKRKILFLGRVE